MATDAPVAETPPEKTLAKDEMTVLKHLGLFPAKEAKGAAEIFGTAKPKEYATTAEEEVASSCAKNDELAEAKANITMYTEAVTLYTGKSGKEGLLGVVQKELADAEKKVESLEKGRVKGKAALSELRSKQAADQAKEDKRLQGIAVSAENATTRHNRLRQVILEEQSKVNARLEEYDKAYLAAQASWTAQALIKEDRHKARMAAWDERIRVAAVDGPQPMDAQMGTPPKIVPLTLAAGQADELQEMKLRAERAEEQLKQQQKPAVVEAAPKTAPPPVTIHPDVHLAITWSVAELPQMTGLPTEPQVEALIMLRANLELWGQMGMVPVTYGQIYTGVDDPKEAMTITATLVGTDIWEKFYTKDRTVLETNLVPLQMAHILKASLAKLQDQSVADEKKQEIAKAHFEGIYRRDMEDKRAGDGAYGFAAY